MARREDSTLSSEFVIRPNCSLSWRGAVCFFLLVAVVLFSIAGWFALAGAWLILPFAGFELLVLGAGLYVCAQRSVRREVITIGDDVVEVSRGRYDARQVDRFTRAWVRVALERPRHPWYPSRLTLGSHGRRVEIGCCLSDDEREGLAEKLNEVLSNHLAAH